MREPTEGPAARSPTPAAHAAHAGHAGHAGRAPASQTGGVADTFASRFAVTRAAHGPLVLGLDPSASLLVSWGLPDSPEGLDRFVDISLRAAAGCVGIVKPQSAFYERHGWRGVRTLERLVAEARSAGLLVVLDAKRGDIGSTNDAYADVYLGPDAPVPADAVTVHPYLGLGALLSLFERAGASGSCVLVVVRSSNPEGRELQTAVTATGRSVEQQLVDEIGAVNARLAPGAIGPVGMVVGPTRRARPGRRAVARPAPPAAAARGGRRAVDTAPGSEADATLDLSSAAALVLAPGLGAQGATAADIALTFADCPDRVMPSASRSLLRLGPDEGRLREGIGTLAEVLRTLLGDPPP